MSLEQTSINRLLLQALNAGPPPLEDMNQFVSWPEEPQPCFQSIDSSPIEVTARQAPVLPQPPQPATAVRYRPIAARGCSSTSPSPGKATVASSCISSLLPTCPRKRRKYCCYECKLSKLEVCDQPSLFRFTEPGVLVKEKQSADGRSATARLEQFAGDAWTTTGVKPSESLWVVPASSLKYSQSR